MTKRLTFLLSKTEFILREAANKFPNSALLWSGGKDSTVLLFIIMALFKKFPFKILTIENRYDFIQVVHYKEKLIKKFCLDVIKIKGTFALENNKFECCNANKIVLLNKFINSHQIDSLIIGIRYDEHGLRSKENHFSPRFNNMQMKESTFKMSESEPEFPEWNLYPTEFKEASHVRIHPLLYWTEMDIWNYIKENNIEVPSIYFCNNGKRFRSIGCQPCTKPMNSNASSVDKIIEEISKYPSSERENRDSDINMMKLRSLGYM